MNSSQSDDLRPSIEAETGMDFSGNRITRLQDAVQRVLSRDKPTANLDRLLNIPQERGLFLERLAAELTVGESFFFRNEHQFRALRDCVLPEILRENSENREVRLWSAGCAGGEEPYSLAILLDQVLGSHHDWRVSILGTDLNPEFLERAREGCYRLWSFRHTQIHQDRSYFSQEAESFRLSSRIRDMVRFAYLNLVKDVYPSPLTGTLGLDLILFRNVAIYLKPEVTSKIIERFYHALRPRGWLLLGESELNLSPTEGFEVRRFEQATFYQKKSGAETPREGLGIAVPVLADVFVEQPERLDAGKLDPSRQASEVSVPTVPRLPDWLTLPKRRDKKQGNAASALQQIEWLLSEGDFDEAERAMERIADKSQRAKLRLKLSQALLVSAAVARARQHLARCLAEEPLLVEAHLLHASFSEEAGDLDAAEKSYRRALYVDRNCPMAHFHLALVLHQKGDAAGAERSIRTTLKLIERKDPHQLVEYGEGVCYGRLREMAQMILAC